MKKFSDWVKASIIYVFPVFALILSFYARETSQAARNALYLCLDVVIPSLFPFFVLSRLTLPYLSGFSCPSFLKRFAEKFFGLPYYALITIILGYLSGYPTGAKLSRDMLDEGLIDTHQAGKLLVVANNCSPLFIMGTLGAGLYKSIRIGFFLLIIHWAAGLFTAFIVGHWARSKERVLMTPRLQSFKKKENSQTGLAWLVPSAVEESAILCIKVTGYIVLFAVLSELLSQIGLFSFLSGIPDLFRSTVSKGGRLSDFFSSFLRGFMEIASGSQAITQIKDASLSLKLSAISMICGFAGFSVHTQIMGIMKGTGIKYRVLFFGKLIQGTMAGLLTLLVVNTVPLTISTSSIQTTSPLSFSIVRLVTIIILILSLGIAPYDKKRAHTHKARPAGLRTYK